MASEKLVRELLAINGALHPGSVPSDQDMRVVLRKFWLDALAPFDDAEVEPIAKAALHSSPYPLKPADIVPKLTRKRLDILPWDEAFADVCRLIDLRNGSFRDSKDSAQKRVADRMLSAFQKRTSENETTLRAQFRDAYHKEVEAIIEDERQFGQLALSGATVRIAEPVGHDAGGNTD